MKINKRLLAATSALMVLANLEIPSHPMHTAIDEKLGQPASENMDGEPSVQNESNNHQEQSLKQLEYNGNPWDPRHP